MNKRLKQLILGFLIVVGVSLAACTADEDQACIRAVVDFKNQIKDTGKKIDKEDDPDRKSALQQEQKNLEGNFRKANQALIEENFEACRRIR